MIGEIIQYTGLYNHPLIQTTDATPATIDVINVNDLYVGQLILFASIIVTDGSAHNEGIYVCKFIKNGTLTIGTLTTLWQDADNAASIAIVNDGSENLKIQATGIAAKEINWIVRSQVLNQDYTGLPL